MIGSGQAQGKDPKTVFFSLKLNFKFSFKLYQENKRAMIELPQKWCPDCPD